jgi:Uma2 family endonuclease
MSSAERPTFVCVEEYLATEELAETKHEYIDGWVRAMTGATVRHNQVTINCLYFFLRALDGKRCQPFHSDMKLRICDQQNTRFYYPDLQVICESNAPSDQFQDTPILIVEVLSPSTRQYDLDEKLNAYLSIPSLQWYVILEQHQPSAIVMRRTEKGFLREVYEGLQAIIDLPELGCSLPLGEVYRNVEFTPTMVREEELSYQYGS